MKTYRTIELAVDFSQRLETLKLTGHLREQLLLAASAISLNLAEGDTMTSIHEKKRLYQKAYGSLKECQAIFRIARVNNNDVLSHAAHLGNSLYQLNQVDLSVGEKMS